MNPLRHEFIASCLDEGLPVRGYGGGKEESSSERERGLRYLDVGCGGGIFAESLARTIRGFDTNSTAASDANATGATDATSTSTSTRTRAGSITAIDPSSTLIQIARNHARTDPTIVSHLRTGRFQYRNTTLESLVAEQQQKEQEQEQPEKLFDVVTLFEVLEHIDPSTTDELVSYLGDSEARVIILTKTFDFTNTEGTETSSGCAPWGTASGCQLAINKDNWCTNYEPNAPTVSSITYNKAGVLGITVNSNKSIVGQGSAGVIKGRGLRIVSGAKNVIIQ